ncbi:MAG TPA: c-type cytochrome [Terracidiphilus sp.]|nr:c-type cytochrome [Terracidiphilus sp.]
MKYLVLAGMILASAVAAARVDRPAKEVAVTVNRTPANDGKLMYASYCSSCHGMDGKGNGPTAPALLSRPADLTALSRNNHGKFPLESVKSALEFGAHGPVHGTVQMPKWGPILDEMDGAYAGQLRGMQRIVALSGYLEAIQQK